MEERAMTVIFGDTSGALSGHQIGGDQSLFGDPNEDTILFGDARIIRGHASGGNDTLTATTSFSNTLFGDAYRISGQAVGGSDVLSLNGTNARATLYGDAY